MAEYFAWNSAIAAYFTAGVAKGSSVFLSLDQEALEEIARGFLDPPVLEEPVSDFLAAVRKECVNPENNGLNINHLKGKSSGIPRSAALLGLMVFSAYQMQDEEGIDETNYFRRLREALRLTSDNGRPPGLRPGAEEPLWKDWNEFLSGEGYQPTAAGGAGPLTYIKYPLSQAILRESDKDSLRRLYHTQNLPANYDSDQLAFWLISQQINRKHLFEGLHHEEKAHVWEFTRAAYRVYEEKDWILADTKPDKSRGTRNTTIECGLYRIEDNFGEPEYYLFPKQPSRLRSYDFSVIPGPGKEPQQLSLLRPGYFEPLWPQQPFVESPAEFTIEGSPLVKTMLFPKRDFWILTCDPENPGYGAWAAWNPFVELGEKMLILCRKGPFAKEMNRFKDTDPPLLRWSSCTEKEGWLEYAGCMILSYEWGGFIPTPECKALSDALSPRGAAGISLTGGLRDPNQNAWLEGFPPSVKIYGFDRKYDLRITPYRGTNTLEFPINRQEEKCLPKSLSPDYYQIEAILSNRTLAMKRFRVISWEEIKENDIPEKISSDSVFSTAGLKMSGARFVSHTSHSGRK